MSVSSIQYVQYTTNHAQIMVLSFYILCMYGIMIYPWIISIHSIKSIPMYAASMVFLKLNTHCTVQSIQCNLPYLLCTSKVLQNTFSSICGIKLTVLLRNMVYMDLNMHERIGMQRAVPMSDCNNCYYRIPTISLPFWSNHNDQYAQVDSYIFCGHITDCTLYFTQIYHSECTI